MRTMSCLLFLSGMLAIASLSSAQPQRQPGQPGKGGPGGRGGAFGGFPKPGQVLSEGLQVRLKLNDDQKKQLADLQKQVDDQLAKILNDEQKEQLKAMSQRGAGGFPGRGDGKGGFPGRGGKGGAPGKGKGAPPPVKDSE